MAFKPGLSCTRQVCSIVMDRRVHLCLLVSDLLFSHQRSREPSHSRAGLTSIGLEIKRTPLRDQTSHRQAQLNCFKTSPIFAFQISGHENWGSRTCFDCYTPCGSLNFGRQCGGAARPQPQLRPLQQGNNRLRGSLRCVRPFRSVPNRLPTSKRLGRTSGNTVI